MKPTVNQSPEPGQHILQFRGDCVTFTVTVQPQAEGQAFVRTTLGQGRMIRREIIRNVELNAPRLGREWFDIPMQPSGPGRYEAVIGLDETGHFEAKCFFLPRGRSEPVWPSGPNTAINVEPADTCCGNIIYNAFVRQFGPYKNLPRSDLSAADPCISPLDKAGFTVIPPSGKFRDLIAELDFIMHQLGCRVIQLLPIHPTPTTYARMGRFGSPYASLSFTAVDPALAVFDPRATPLDQFLELVDAVHARQGKLIIDIAINHTGWAASLHESHPQWLARNNDGEIQNPGAWGVVWEDLARLDYGHKEMWTYMARVFLTWCRRGVDGFRCDAGYMIPTAAWQYMIAKVRDQYPDTLFLLEGLGGKISVTRDLLNLGNFNWAYSELFQNYDRGQIEWYLPGANEISASDGTHVHFAETHDNNRLAATSTAYARMRTALSALLAPFGAFGFTNGVEWFASEKINVHEVCALNWGAADNQVEAVARLALVLKTHPAFGHPVDLELVAVGDGNFIALRRLRRDSGRWALVLANLDWQQAMHVGWDLGKADFAGRPAVDLLSGAHFPVQASGHGGQAHLAPGQVVCLVPDDDPWLGKAPALDGAVPPEAVHQQLRAKVLQIHQRLGLDLPVDPDQAGERLQADPEGYCRSLNQESASPRVITWQHPTDLRRQVMVPPGHFLLLRCDHPCRVRISRDRHMLVSEHNLLDAAGRPFVLVPPLPPPESPTLFDLEITCYAPQETTHRPANLLLLGEPRDLRVRMTFSRDDCLHIPLVILGTDGRGAMMRVHADWQRLDSRYDALLAANLNPDVPDDRRVLLSRLRAWVVFQGFSQDVNLASLEHFGFDYHSNAWWQYQIPTGQGEHIVLRIGARMPSGSANTLCLTAMRLPKTPGRRELDDDKPVTLIVRPDIEDRNFHNCTKAYTGPETQWPEAIQPSRNGFVFSPAGHYGLGMQISRGRYTNEPQWQYMVHRSLEAERGLDPDSDLFSPGYFTASLKGGQQASFTAAVCGSAGQADLPGTEARLPEPQPDLPFQTALEAALDHYVVRRGNFSTVIAGYPWFLDWGRDTLIVTRGLIAAGRFDTALAIVRQFARFEQNGTIPNMIRGNDASNRDTSDAPLWLFTACADLAAARGGDEFLSGDCNGRSLRRILIDMAHALTAGTPNGIRMDPASALIYSPSHFTWMDTNFPAGSPRQGYPIEIQALWHAALTFLVRIDPRGRDQWHSLAQKVRQSIHNLFWRPERGYLVDCRHAEPGQSAQQASADDALRPNQLLALTLGAVDDKAIGRSMLQACQTLLVPGAIRSLADRPVGFPLEVRRDGRLINNPRAPYWGRYEGDEDTRRKPAYHNGTAWTWPVPLYCEAWVACYGPAERAAALAWLSSSILLINGHCVGQVPEIVDGDAPHRQRGCDAQAWGVSELLRVWKKLQESPDA
ncbi:MAG: amylo-alpha-1,6-glucosidase [Desulfosarcinaceae bacterium]